MLEHVGREQAFLAEPLERRRHGQEVQDEPEREAQPPQRGDRRPPSRQAQGPPPVEEADERHRRELEGEREPRGERTTGLPSIANTLWLGHEAARARTRAGRLDGRGARLPGAGRRDPQPLRTRGARRDARADRRASISSVGAVVVGLGVVLFVAANWDGMPRPTRVVLLLALVAAAYAAGYVLRERRGTHPHVGEALYLLGGLAFAAEHLPRRPDVPRRRALAARVPRDRAAHGRGRRRRPRAGARGALARRPRRLAAHGAVRARRRRRAVRAGRGGAATAARCTASGRATAAPRPGRLPRADAGARAAAAARSGPSCSRSRRRTHAVDDVDGRRARAGRARRACGRGRRAAPRSSRCCRGRRTAPWEAAGLLASTFLVVLAVLAPRARPGGRRRPLPDPVQPPVRGARARRDRGRLPRGRAGPRRRRHRRRRRRRARALLRLLLGLPAALDRLRRRRRCCCSGSRGSSSGSGRGSSGACGDATAPAAVRGARRGAGAAAARPHRVERAGARLRNAT